MKTQIQSKLKLTPPLLIHLITKKKIRTGKPIIIEKQQTNQDGKNENIEYRIIEEEEPNKP